MTIEKFVFDFPLYHKVDKVSYDELADCLSKENEEVLIEGYNCIKETPSTFYLNKGLGDELVCDFDYQEIPHDNGYYEFILLVPHVGTGSSAR